MEADASLNAQPAHRAVRVVALERVHDAARGYQHLLKGEDDGLHALRVALRRLRTWIRAFRPYVDDTLKKKTRQRLTAIARATSKARDSEVAAAWVAACDDPPPRAVVGFRDVARRLGSERDEALASVRARLERDLPSLLAALNKQLALQSDRNPAQGGTPTESMATAAAEMVDRQSERVAIALAEVQAMSDSEAIHRARIAAKRLRYLLEPTAVEPDARDRLARLVVLQDCLGSARDAHGLLERFVHEIGDTAARDARLRALHAIGAEPRDARRRRNPRVRPGLVELARRAHQSERKAFTEFVKEKTRWIAEHSSKRPALPPAERS